jgi:sulfatase maturation enzyme AslB (radical SAM superfamily)
LNLFKLFFADRPVEDFVSGVDQQINDSQRVYADGRGAFQDVAKSLKALK